MMVIPGKRNWGFVTCLDLLLGLEWPEFDPDRADDNIVGHRVVVERTQDILRSVSHPINDSLDALIVTSVPDLDNLVRAQTDQMVPLFVNVKVGH